MMTTNCILVPQIWIIHLNLISAAATMAQAVPELGIITAMQLIQALLWCAPSWLQLRYHHQYHPHYQYHCIYHAYHLCPLLRRKRLLSIIELHKEECFSSNLWAGEVNNVSEYKICLGGVWKCSSIVTTTDHTTAQTLVSWNCKSFERDGTALIRCSRLIEEGNTKSKSGKTFFANHLLGFSRRCCFLSVEKQNWF